MEKKKTKMLKVSAGLIVVGLVIGGIGLLNGWFENIVLPETVYKMFNSSQL